VLDISIFSALASKRSFDVLILSVAKAAGA